MPLTIAQTAKLEEEPLRKYVLTNLLREIKVAELLPFQTVDSFTSIATRLRTLPSVAFRALNSSYTEDTSADVEQDWESVYIMGGEIKLDRMFKKVKNYILDPEKFQVDAKILAIAYKFNDYFINGDLAVDPLGFQGLKKRASLMPTSQSIYYAGASSAALDVTASVANARTLFDKIEEQMSATNEGNFNFWMVNKAMKLGFGKAARYMQSAAYNWLDVTKDSFERQVLNLWGHPVYDVGLKADQSTEIITDSEIAGDGDSDATSIYAVSCDAQKGLVGIELSPLETVPLAEVQGNSTTRGVLFEWAIGLAQFGSYSITRGRNVEGASNWA